ncbi:hypothetical protein [Rhizobium sp. SGZ-381]|uniref:hypothetical protein n=1 Tax=Rhizobium sp. SGZ-381 TaxID=3342800 RepID=UPI003670F7EC
MTTSYYSTGTVTLTNGSATVTGTGTAWQTALITGGNIFVQAPGNVLPIATVNSETQITAELQWTGTTGTYAYRIQRDTAYLKTLDTNSQNLAYLLSEMRQGTLFKYDQAGTFSGRDVFDTQPKGFAYLVIDGESPELYVKLSATSGDWVGPFAYGTGPAGPAGPVGALTPRGTYSAGTAYEENDNVLYNGSSFVALQATTGNAPPTLPTTSNTYWSLIAAKGADGAGTGDVVGPSSSTDGAIAAADGTTGKAVKFLTAAQARTAIGAGLLPGDRNVIINALGAVNQRGVSGTVTLAAGAYGHDRFKAGASGCTYTFATSNGVTTFTISSGSLQQVIEANAFAGRSGTWYLSWSGTAQGRINGGSYGASGAVSATCNGSSNVTVEWNSGTLSLPQFERGFVSDFSTRSLPEDLVRCQRYYESIYWHSEGTNAGSNIIDTLKWNVTKRATPNITNNGGSLSNATGITTDSITTDTARLIIASSSAGAVRVSGRQYLIDAEL